MRFLYAITTYDGYAYVDLGLTIIKERCGIDCVVFDDGSYSKKLQQVCNKHNVLLIGKTNHKTPLWCKGDFTNTINAIRYADFNGYDYVIKCSRRWICLENPLKSLLPLIIKTDGNTFGMFDRNRYILSNNQTHQFYFRTQFMCLKVKQWMKIADKMDELSKHYTLETHGLVQDVVHQCAKQIQPNNDKYNNIVISLRKQLQVPQQAYGYVPWQFMGNTKNNPPDYILWHQKYEPKEYLKIAKQLHLNYKAKDFILDKKEREIK